MNSQVKQNERLIIWGNVHLDLDDWRADLEEEYPHISENELYNKMLEINAFYLDDERSNLDVSLKQPIIVIADYGRWNGRFPGYRMINSGNIKDCLYSNMDMAEWYIDKYGDLRADEYHHDGVNRYLYRVFKPGVSDTQIENLQGKIYEGKATRADISRITRRLGDDISKVYGFTLPNMKQTKEQAR